MSFFLLGTSPHLMKKGFNESICGRYVRAHNMHWSYCDVGLNEYIYYGGFPDVYNLEDDQSSWQKYVARIHSYGYY